MFLTSVLIFHLIATTVGNPFHKYPFVFLLDVGNEEIQKTAEEQIRISVPGGSLALRYPGTTGDKLIAHVRVSGIDFGTDLKADIVEGGPGYNYVVLLFKGNPGVAYDAVVTVQTLTSDSTDYITQKDYSNMSDGNSETNQVPEESVETNDNAEDENGNSLGGNNNNQNEELTQYSSNVYSYAHNQDSNGDDSVEDGNNDDIEVSGSEEDTNAAESDSVEEEDSVSDKVFVESKNAGVNYNNYQEENADSPKAYRYRPHSVVGNIGNSLTEDESYDGEDPGDLPSDVYRRYNELTSNDGQKAQEAIDDPQDDEWRIFNDVQAPNNNQVEMDQAYNDEEIHNERKEINNNYPDFDEIPPAES